MKRSMLVLIVILLLSLAATTSVMADSDTELPAWEQVFNPVPIYGEGFFMPLGVEFKNQMYFNGFSSETTDQDRVWRTPDGDNWSLAWEASSIQEGFEGIGPLFVFKNQLYLVVWDWQGEETARLMRTRDGKHWEEVAREEWADTYYTSFNGFGFFSGHVLHCKYKMVR